MLEVKGNMVNIAVCDDKLEMLDYLENEIGRNMHTFGKEYTLNKFSNPEHLKKIAKKEEINLLFLDIEMPKMNGFDLAKELRSNKNKRKLHVVFVTSYESRVFESFEYRPFWFMRKIEIQHILPKILTEFFNKMEEENVFHEFRNGANSKVAKIMDVIYLECNLHKITIKTISGEFEIYGSLKSLEKELQQYKFIRIHKNYLVNPNHIFSIDVKTIMLTDKSILPLSKERKKKVKQMLL